MIRTFKKHENSLQSGHVYDRSLIYATTDEAVRRILRLSEGPSETRLPQDNTFNETHQYTSGREPLDDESAEYDQVPVYLYQARNDEEDENFFQNELEEKFSVFEEF